VVGGEPYEIFLTEGAGFRLTRMQCDGAGPLPPVREGGLVRSGCRPSVSGEIAWSARFEKPGSHAVHRQP
jgi:hypothetical protein